MATVSPASKSVTRVASAGAHPATARRWPFVPRDTETALPRDARDFKLPCLPRDKIETNIHDRLGKQARKLPEYTSFREESRRFHSAVANGKYKSMYAMGGAYHQFGQACKSARLWRAAIPCFEQDYLISTKYLEPAESIPALRALAECYEALGDYHQAVLFCEQNLTVAARVNQKDRKAGQEEVQGAYVKLGLITLHWCDALVDSNACTYEDRKLLAKQVRAYFSIAHDRAFAFEVGVDGMTIQKKREIYVNAKINYAIAYQLEMTHLAAEGQEVTRKNELDQELAEGYDQYTEGEHFLRTDGLVFEAKRVFNPNVIPAKPANRLLQEAKRVLNEGEVLCFDEGGLGASEVIAQVKQLPSNKLEIDPQEGDPEAGTCDIARHSDLQHNLGQLYESAGLLPTALSHYIFAVRRLNALAPLARTDRTTFETIINGQRKSLHAALLVCIKFEQYDYAEKLARQMRILNQRAKQRETRDNPKKKSGSAHWDQEAHDQWVATAAQATQLIQEHKALSQTLATLDVELQTLKSQSKERPITREESAQIYDLERRKRDAIAAHLLAIREACAPPSEDGDESERERRTTGLTIEWHGRMYQMESNSEREMLNILRKERQRRIEAAAAAAAASSLAMTDDPPIDASATLPMSREEFVTSLMTEARVWLKLAWSITEFCKLHLARSPHRELEIQLAHKYWKIALHFWHVISPFTNTRFRTPADPNETVPDASEWEGMLYREEADALTITELVTDRVELRRLRVHAWNALEKWRGRPIFEFMKVIQLELAQYVVDSYEDTKPAEEEDDEEDEATTKIPTARTQADLAEQARWVKILEDCQAAWKRRCATVPGAAEWTEDRIQQVFEGERPWPLNWTPEVTPVVAPSEATASDAPSPVKNAKAAANPNPVAAAPAPVPAAITLKKKLTRPLEGDREDDDDVEMTAPTPVAPASTKPPAGASTSNTARRTAAITPVASSASKTSTSSSRSRAAATTATATATAHPKQRRKRVRIRPLSESQSGDEADDDGLPRQSNYADHYSAMDVDDEADSTLAVEEPSRKRQHIGGNEDQQANAPSIFVQGLSGVSYLESHPLPTLPQAPSPASMFASVAPTPVIIQLVPASTLAPAPIPIYRIQDLAVEELVVEVRRLKRDSGKVHALACRRNRFNAASAAELLQLLKGSNMPMQPAPPLACLQTFDLSFTMMEPQQWGDLLLALPKLPRLRTLVLRGTHVGEWCLPHLHRAISRSTQLRSLNLDGCMYLNGIDEPQALVAALTSQSCLEELSLQGCPLTPIVVAHLFDHLLRSCPQLVCLNLSYLYFFAQSYVYQAAFPTDTEKLNFPPLAANEPKSEDDLRASWLKIRTATSASQRVLMGSRQLEELKEGYDAMVHFATTAPSAQAESKSPAQQVTLKLSGWSNVLNELSNALQRALTSPTCRLSALELFEAGFSLEQLKSLATALTKHHDHAAGAKSLTRLALTPHVDTGCRINEAHKAFEPIRHAVQIVHAED